MEMRHHNRIDRFRVDAGGLHAFLHHQACGRGHLSAGSGIEHDRPIAHANHGHGEGDRNVGIGNPGLPESLLRLLDGGVLDEVRIVRLLPNSVVKLNHLQLADLKPSKPGKLVAWTHRLRGADEGQWAPEPKGSCGGGGRQYKRTAG